MVELSLLAGAIVIYVITALAMPKEKVRKFWFILFIIIMLGTVCCITFMRFDADGLLANAKEMSELYIIYFLVAILPAVAFINLWMFRKPIWRVLCGKDININMDEEAAKAKK